MYSISFIVPDKDMISLVESVIKQDRSITRNIQKELQYSYTVNVAQEIHQVPRQAIDADIVIARDSICDGLRRVYPNLPVVEMPIGSEMTAAIVKAAKEHGQAPIGVIGSFSICYAAEAVKDLLEVNLKTFLLETHDAAEITMNFNQALSEDRWVIICGTGTKEYAKAQKIPGVHLHMMGMSRESVLEAITRAKSEMESRKREKERALQFQMLINLAHEGIITADANATVNAINVVAAEILGIKPQHAMGANVWSLFPRDQLPDSFRTDLGARTIFHNNGKNISLRFGKMIMAANLAGMVLTLDLVE